MFTRDSLLESSLMMKMYLPQLRLEPKTPKLGSRRVHEVGLQDGLVGTRLQYLKGTRLDGARARCCWWKVYCKMRCKGSSKEFVLEASKSDQKSSGKQ